LVDQTYDKIGDGLAAAKGVGAMVS